MTAVRLAVKILDMPVPDLLGTVEAAAVIGVQRSTLSHWIAKGRISPAMKLPGTTGALLFERAEVERVRDEYAAAGSETVA